MKPSPFEYLTPATVAEAAAILAERGDGVRILAGGQSLVPLMNFRMVEPDALVDISRIAGLDTIAEDGPGGLRIGALVRHQRLETSPLVARRFPVLAEAITHVAHLAVRNRGTIGGSLCHADPAAELPMMVLLLDATMHALSRTGERAVPAAEFFAGPLATSLGAGEILTAVTFPALPQNMGWGFEEVVRRDGDFALAGAAALVRMDGDGIAEARLALLGLGETPLRVAAAEALLTGAKLSDGLLDSAAEEARKASDPMEDLHASADFRRHLARVVARRALAAALTRAGAGS